MTSELTLLVLRLGFLAVLWIFVFSIIYALRSDLFGTRASEYQRRMEQQSLQQTFGAADQAPTATPPHATSPPPRPHLAARQPPRAPARSTSSSPRVRAAASRSRSRTSRSRSGARGTADS